MTDHHNMNRTSSAQDGEARAFVTPPVADNRPGTGDSRDAASIRNATKRRIRKAADKAAADAAGAEGKDAGAEDHGGKAAGSGGNNGLLYGLGGLALVGGGLALAGGGGGGGTTTPTTPADTTPPTAPTATLTTDTGSSSSDKITSNGKVDVGGLESGATWEYSTNGGTTWQAGSGTSFTLASGSYAENKVLVRQKDAAGNVSASGALAGAVTVDGEAPKAPTVDNVATDNIVSAAEKADGVTVSGKAEALSSVSVVWGGTTHVVQADKDGVWRAKFTSSEIPADGSSTIKVSATDAAGNVSANAQKDISIDTRLTVSGTIVLGPLVAGNGLTVSFYGSDGKLLLADVAVKADGSFTAQLPVKAGDIVIAKLADSGTGADYADEATGAPKDLNAPIFAAVLVKDLTSATQVQINPLTTLAAIKAGLAADGSGAIANAAALEKAYASVASAFGLADLSTTPVAANSADFNPSDGMSAGEKLGLVLAALSGLDKLNGGDSAKTLSDLATQLGSGDGLNVAAMKALMDGAAAADGAIAANLRSLLSDQLQLASGSARLNIGAIASDNIVSATEAAKLEIAGDVGAGATSVKLAYGDWSANAVLNGGKWSYALTADDLAALGADGAKVFRVTAVFEDGSTAGAARPVVFDTTPPDAPKIDAVGTNNVVNIATRDSGITLSGQAEGGATINGTWGGKAFTAQVDGNGQWQAKIKPADVPTASARIEVSATDSAGNQSAAARLDVAVDLLAPAKPMIDPVSVDDVVTNEERAAAIKLSGKAEANATIVVNWGPNLVNAQTTADADGRWSLTVDPAKLPPVGSSDVRVQAVDAAGNKSDVASRSTAIYGVLNKPVILPVSSDDIVGSIDGVQGAVFHGLGRVGSLVSISFDGAVIWSGTVDDQGYWTSAPLSLSDLPPDGRALLTAQMYDASGSLIGSADRAFVIDTVAPEPAEINPIADDNVVNIAEAANGVVISGKAEEGSTVRLAWNGKVWENIPVVKGVWQISLNASDFPDGASSEAVVTVSDAAGNVSQPETVFLTVDRKAPDAPSLALMEDTHAPANSSDGSKDFVTSNASLKLSNLEQGGSWEYSTDGVKWLEGGDANTAVFDLEPGVYEIGAIRVRQKDAAGNISAITSNDHRIVIDTQAVDIRITSSPKNDLVNAASKNAGVTIGGSFEPGGMISVSWGEINGKPNIMTATADAEGNWSVTFDAAHVPSDGEVGYVVTAYDIAGNKAVSDERMVTIDTLPPSPPAITEPADSGDSAKDGITRNADVAVSNLEPGASWEYSTDGGATWQKGTGDKLTLAPGVYAADAIRIRQIDSAGNASEPAKITRSLTIDTSADGLTLNGVTSDNIVNIVEHRDGVTLSGRGEAGAHIALYWGSEGPFTADVSSDGLWQIALTGQQLQNLASATLSVTQTDIAGNVSAPVSKEVRVELTPPAKPEIVKIGGVAVGTTASVINNAAKSAGVLVEGTGVEGTKVKVSWGDAFSTIVEVGSDGRWSALVESAKVPKDGSTTLFAHTIDAIGNESDDKSVAVKIDTAALPPIVGSVSGTEPTNAFVNAAAKAAGAVLKGTAEAFAQVYVNWRGVNLAPVTADSEGKWQVTVDAAQVGVDGKSSFTVWQTDAAGNTSASSNVSVTIDTQKPGIPKINSLTSDDILTGAELAQGFSFYGQSEANAQVNIYQKGTSTLLFSTTADQFGVWRVDVPANGFAGYNGDLSLVAVAKDAAGNVSDGGGRIVTIARSPGVVIAPATTDNIISAAEKAAGVRFSGLATPGSTLTFQLGTFSKDVTVQSNGSWSITLKSSDLPATDGNWTISVSDGQSSATRIVELDTVPPAAPALAATAASENASVASGAPGAVKVTAENGSLLKLTFSDGTNQVVKEVRATGSEQSIALSVEDLGQLRDGRINVTASASGSVSGVGQASTASFVLDRTAATASLTSIAGDGIVNLLEKTQGITISGTVDEDGASVALVGSTATYPATMNGRTWTATIPSADIGPDGTSTITVRVTDAAGNVSTQNASFAINATPHLAIHMGTAAIIADAGMFGLSASSADAASTSITISNLTHGSFTKAGVDGAVTQFTLADVLAGNISFAADGTSIAPTYSVAVSDGKVSSSATPAHVAFSAAAMASHITGTDGQDVIVGGDGDQILAGGKGDDILYGHGSGQPQGSDNDIFLWGRGDAGAGAKDVVRDFVAWNGTSGDKIDISGLLEGYTAGSSNLADWVSVQTNVTLPGATGWDAGKSGTLLTIDVDGAGSGTVQQLIFLENVTLSTTNVDALKASGVILSSPVIS